MEVMSRELENVIGGLRTMIDISDGYILPKMDLMELKDFTQDFRKKIRAASRKLVAKEIAKEATFYLDFSCLDNKRKELMTSYIKDSINKSELRPMTPCTYAYIRLYYKERDAELKRKGSSQYDFNCNLVLFPSQDYILAILFCEQEEYRKIFEEYEFVSPYPYVEASESEHLSEDDQVKRERWFKALGETFIPYLEGLVVPCYTRPPILTAKNLIDYVNEMSIDERAGKLANLIVVQCKIEKLNHLPEKEKAAQFQKYLETDEFKEEIDDEIDYIKELLIKNVTRKDLVKVR